MFNLGPDYGNDDYFTGYHEHPQVVEMEKRKEVAEELFSEVLKMLYSRGELDLLELENLLDEMCDYFKMKIPHGDLNIQRPKNVWPIIDPLEYNKIFEDLQ